MAAGDALLLLLSLAAVAGAGAQVPASRTFTYVNEGEFGPFITEYGDSYRATDLFAAPFQLMWHNTTPGRYYIGLRMGLRRSESLFRWVWDANRGRPVGENATFSFRADGDLVLAEADGRPVWSAGTANRGVVGLRLLPVGNIVLYDKRGRTVWQSFDHPTDTLMIGQSLRLAGPAMKLVSRRSETENSEGKYSLVLEPRGLALYVAAAASPKPLPYYNYLGAPFGRLTFSKPTNLTFAANPDGNGVWDLELQGNSGSSILARPKYNGTLSILRLQVDGNLVIFTYFEPADSEAWDRTFAFFSDENRAILPACELPGKCGALGLCADGMCVACPTAKGLLGWSEACRPPARGPCNSSGAGAEYFKVAGVESFLTKFSRGSSPVKVEDCRRKCSSDCKCLGFFYWEESSRCWQASSTIATLAKVSNSSHVAYIKSS